MRLMAIAFMACASAACGTNVCEHGSQVAEKCAGMTSYDRARCDAAIDKCSDTDAEKLDSYLTCTEENEKICSGSGTLEDLATCLTKVEGVADACMAAFQG